MTVQESKKGRKSGATEMRNRNKTPKKLGLKKDEEEEEARNIRLSADEKGRMKRMDE